MLFVILFVMLFIISKIYKMSKINVNDVRNN